MHLITFLPVSARLLTVDVHLCSKLPQYVMQAHLTGGVVTVKIPLCSYQLLDRNMYKVM